MMFLHEKICKITIDIEKEERERLSFICHNKVTREHTRKLFSSKCRSNMK